MTSITGNNFQSSQNISNTNSTETLINNINLQINEINDDIDQLSLLVSENETAINTLETEINQVKTDTTDITYNSSTDTTTINNKLTVKDDVEINAVNDYFTNNQKAQLSISNTWTTTNPLLTQYPTNRKGLFSIAGYFGSVMAPLGNRMINPKDLVIGIEDPDNTEYRGSIFIGPLTSDGTVRQTSMGCKHVYEGGANNYIIYQGMFRVIYRPTAYTVFETQLYTQKDGITYNATSLIPKILVNETNITSLTTRVTNVETVNTTQTTNITNLTTRVTNVETVNTTQTDDITALTTRVTNVETVNTTQTTNITDLTTRVTDIESSIASAPTARTARCQLFYDGVAYDIRFNHGFYPFPKTTLPYFETVKYVSTGRVRFRIQGNILNTTDFQVICSGVHKTSSLVGADILSCVGGLNKTPCFQGYDFEITFYKNGILTDLTTTGYVDVIVHFNV